MPSQKRKGGKKKPVRLKVYEATLVHGQERRRLAHARTGQYSRISKIDFASLPRSSQVSRDERKSESIDLPPGRKRGFIKIILCIQLVLRAMELHACTSYNGAFAPISYRRRQGKAGCVMQGTRSELGAEPA